MLNSATREVPSVVDLGTADSSVAGDPVQRHRIEQLAFETVEKIESADSVVAVSEAFAKLVAAAGLSYSVCLKVPEAGEDATNGLLLNQLPGDWWPLYLERDYLPFDPVVHEVRNSFRPFTWREITARGHATQQARNLFAEAADFGMKDGFVVPIYETSGYTGLVSISGESCDLKPETRSALSIASVYLHNKLCGIRRQTAGIITDLTEREAECLTWAAGGKSDWEIGQILCISSKTVNYHIENAKRKFGVSTRVQAIVSALRHGYIRH